MWVITMNVTLFHDGEGVSWALEYLKIVVAEFEGRACGRP